MAIDTSQIPEEYREHFGDLWWRLTNLYFIVDEKGKRIQFVPNDAQRKLLVDMWWKNIILKSRQHGMTTFIQLYMLDKILWNNNLAAGVSAHNLLDAQAFFRNKIKYAFDNLPDWAKVVAPRAVKNEAGELILDNGSSIKVGVSLRSGTYQLLHISEYGKLCRHSPIKAEEVKTGSLNTLHDESMCWIESTAEGRDGEFYRMSKAAQDLAATGKPLTRMDFKHHFFAWWQDKRNRLDPAGVIIPIEKVQYFAKLKAEHGIVLDSWQMAWYVKKAEEQGEHMKQEHPSTPQEAFEASIEGAYLANQMLWLRENGRIAEVPWEPLLPVNTFWDIGVNDEMVIWFHQRVGKSNRLIDLEWDTGEGFEHYARILKGKGYIYGQHFLPHDVGVRDPSAIGGRTREQVLIGLGVKPIKKIPRAKNQEEVYQGIESIRAFLKSCWIDEVTCKKGVDALDGYRREWDEKGGTWKNRPLHSWESNFADALRTGAVGFRDIEVTSMADVMPEATEAY